MHEAEVATIRAFVVPARRARLAALLAKPDRQSRLFSVLPHQRILDTRFMAQVPAGRHSAPEIAAMLRERGAPATCRVIGGDLDEQQLGLDEALDRVVGWNEGCIVICIPGRLAYFEGEELGYRYILQR